MADITHLTGIPPPASGNGQQQQVVYHIYQMPAQSGTNSGINIKLKKVNVKPMLRPGLLFFQWAFWIIYIAGAALIQRTCNNSDMPILPFGSFTAAGTPPIGIGACTQYFSLLWWSVFLQFFTIIGATFIWIAHLHQLNKYESTVMYFHIMSSVLMFSIAYAFVNIVFLMINNLVVSYNAPHDPISVSFDYANSAYLICAGSIGNMICNFLYIILMSKASSPTVEEIHESIDANAEIHDAPAHKEAVVVSVDSAPSGAVKA